MRTAKRRRIDHETVAQEALSQPGQWVPASEHNMTSTARSVARTIATGQGPTVYRDGRYETDVRPSELRSRIWVRYLGPCEEAIGQ